MASELKRPGWPPRKYSIESIKKVATVYPNGYGLVSFKATIVITEPGFVGPIHYFGLTDTVAEDVVLPPLEVMSRGGALERGEGPHFNYRLLEPLDDTFRMYPVELPEQGTARMRTVRFEISPACSVDQRLTYAWEWGFPGMYRVAPGDSDSSGFRCTVPLPDLRIEVRFIHPAIQSQTAFTEEPCLSVVREDGSGTSLPIKRELSLWHLAFRWSVLNAQPGDQYVASWRTAIGRTD